MNDITPLYNTLLPSVDTHKRVPIKKIITELKKNINTLLEDDNNKRNIILLIHKDCEKNKKVSMFNTAFKQENKNTSINMEKLPDHSIYLLYAYYKKSMKILEEEKKINEMRNK